MSGEFLPQKMLVFIQACFRSVEQLEILLLLRSRSDLDWTAERINAEIRSRKDSVESRLQSLCKQGFLVKISSGSAPVFRYQPKTPDIGECVEQLAELYAVRRISVIQAIYTRGEGSRRDSMEDFAEAFKL